MKKALTMTSTRRRKNTVILEALSLQPSQSVNIFVLLRRLGAAVFSRTGIIVAMCAVALLMWVHILAADDMIVLQRRIAVDALLCTPWALAYMLKGGRR